jgi:hypothetical protein
MKTHFLYKRSLNIVVEGETHSTTLYIVKLEQISDGQWACYWTMEFVQPQEARIYGDDPLQALYRCINFIEDLIKGLNKIGKTIWWTYDGDCGGFNYAHNEVTTLAVPPPSVPPTST